MARYTFTRASDGELIETSEHPNLKAVTARGKELGGEHGNVLISEEAEKPVKAEPKAEPKPKRKR